MHSILAGKIQQHLASQGEKTQELHRQLKMINKRIEAVEEKYLTKPDLSESTYNRIIVTLKSDQSRLYNQLAALYTNQQAYWDQMQGMLAKLLDIRTAFTSLPLNKKQQFINMVFCNSLY